MATQFAKGQIVYLCSLMVMVFVIMSYLSVQQLQNSNQTRMMDEGIENQRRLSLEIFKTDVDFFGYELNDEEFYKTGKSVYLSRHDSLIDQIHKLFKQATAEKENDNTIEPFLNRYDSAFHDIVKKINSRGYKDYGLEGKMRTFSSVIEKSELIPKVDLLTLRQYEKDYLLSSDDRHVKKFDSLMRQLRSKPRSAQTNDLLDKYSGAFHELVNISDEIGLETQTHLKGNLDHLTKPLISAIEMQDRKADEEVFGSYQRGLIFFCVGIIGCAILCISLIVVIAKKL